MIYDVDTEAAYQLNEVESVQMVGIPLVPQTEDDAERLAEWRRQGLED